MILVIRSGGKHKRSSPHHFCLVPFLTITIVENGPTDSERVSSCNLTLLVLPWISGSVIIIDPYTTESSPLNCVELAFRFPLERVFETALLMWSFALIFLNVFNTFGHVLTTFRYVLTRHRLRSGSWRAIYDAANDFKEASTWGFIPHYIRTNIKYEIPEPL